MPNAMLKKVRYKVTGRNILECEGRFAFTAHRHLGVVVAYSDDDAETKARAAFPGWHDYSVWCIDDTAAAVLAA